MMIGVGEGDRLHFNGAEHKLFSAKCNEDCWEI